jgi:hypothetical protein
VVWKKRFYNIDFWSFDSSMKKNSGLKRIKEREREKERKREREKERKREREKERKREREKEIEYKDGERKKQKREMIE